MASLSDQIDRLARHTRAIRLTAATTAPQLSSPFAHAVLHAHLADLIRDIDPSELGLFRLLPPTARHPPDKDVKPEAAPEVARVEFTAATPLRKPPTRRDTQKPTDTDPEVYAHAALKYIDRYQPIRSMPRAQSQVLAILDRLNTVRENISHLSELLKQSQIAEAPSLTSQADDEQHHIEKLQSTIMNLKKRKEAALGQQNNTRAQPSQPGPKVTVPSSPVEDRFWNTPAAAARTLRFTDNLLLDEEVDLEDVSMSFMSPAPPSPSIRSHHPVIQSPQFDDTAELYSVDDVEQLVAPPEYHDEPEQLDDSILSLDGDESANSDDEGEKTVMVKQPPSISTRPPLSPVAVTDLELPPSTEVTETPTAKKAKVRINNEVERIVTKIWSTSGDIIMPGHHFDTSGTSSFGNRPPRAKETIAHLQSLSDLSPSLASPSTSSVSSLMAGTAKPTSQQILTAYLLLALLGSPPHFSMPLNKVKELLTSKAGGGTLGQGMTRVLYGCVAKRLVKIERGGGEQIVKFDI